MCLKTKVPRLCRRYWLSIPLLWCVANFVETFDFNLQTIKIDNYKWKKEQFWHEHTVLKQFRDTKTFYRS